MPKWLNGETSTRKCPIFFIIYFIHAKYSTENIIKKEIYFMKITSMLKNSKYVLLKILLQ